MDCRTYVQQQALLRDEAAALSRHVAGARGCVAVLLNFTMDIIEVLAQDSESSENDSDWRGLDTGDFFENHPALAVGYVVFMTVSALTAVCGNLLVS